MFNEFPLHKALLKAVAELGYDEPTPVQEEVIPAALEGRDLRITAETGSGKSAAFLLPTLHRLLTTPRRGTAIRALVLAPTRELAAQLLEGCRALCRHTRLQAAMIGGGEHFGDQMESLEARPDLLIATPGRLVNHLKLGSADLGELEVLILDEADRMLEMGLSPDVLDIVRHCNPVRQNILCSATLRQKEMRGLADRVLHEPLSIDLGSGREAPDTIRHQRILADHHDHKLQLLQWLLAHEEFTKALVFTNSRERAEQLGGRLLGGERRAAVLHGDMDQPQRNRVLALLRDGQIDVVVATDVAARGLDIEGVDLVVNFDMARRGDQYLHRTGRTGRAGKEGLAISLIDHTEWNLAASIQRYLRRQFEPRAIDGLKGSYTGPEKLKASGKAAGTKDKKRKKKKQAAVKKKAKRPKKGR